MIDISARFKRCSSAGPTFAIVIAVTSMFAIQARADTGQPADAGFLTEIIVTAQKRVENIQDVPISMSVLGGKELENLHATSLQDYAAYMPGVVITDGGGPGQTTITIRGLAQLSDTSTVGTYIDETPVGSSGAWARETEFSLDLMPYDLERVEVLKGPQGTLYGANAMGGIVKYVTRAPDLQDFDAAVGAESFWIDGGNRPGVAYRASVNVPIVTDQLAIRASYFNEQTPGYINNPTLGEKNDNRVYQQGGRVSLLWKPIDALSVKLTAIVQKIDSDNNASVLRGVNYAGPQLPFYPSGAGMPVPTGAIADLTYPHPLDEPFEKEVRYYAGTLNWALGFADLTSATSYSTVDTTQVEDVSLLYGPLVGGNTPFTFNLNLNRVTEELRLASNSKGRFEWLIGAYYDDEDAQNSQTLAALTPTGQPIDGLNPLALASIPSVYREVSFFANATYKFTDEFDLTAGARWSTDKQHYENSSSGVVVPTAVVSGKSSDNVVTYAVSPRYYVSRDIMTYVRVATGFRPGSPNVILPGVPPQVNSDSTVNYEAGIKSSLFDKHVLLDVAIYRIDWKDIQLPSGNGVIGWNVNGGTAKTQGIEATAEYSPIKALTVTANVAYIDAKLTQDVILGSGLDWFAGAKLPQAPAWNASLLTTYEFPVQGDWQGRVGAGYRFIDKRFNNVEGLGQGPFPPSSILSSYSIVDANTGLFDKHWNLSVYAKNLLNKRAYVNDNFIFAPTYALSTVVQPRTLGVSVDYRF